MVTASCQIAKHRKSNTLEVRDVQLHLGLYFTDIDVVIVMFEFFVVKKNPLSHPVRLCSKLVS